MAVAGLCLSGPAFGQATAEAPPAPDPAELYQQALDLGLWISEQTLTIPSAAPSFTAHINAMDSRESATISSWIGVHQTGNVATVLFTMTGQDVVFSDVVNTSDDATCRHLNDGRWWCETNVEAFKIRASFYLERATLGGEADADAARPTTAPTTAPPRR